MDGRYTKVELQRLVESDESFVKIKAVISDLDCHIVDEASMISSHIFEQVQ